MKRLLIIIILGLAVIFISCSGSKPKNQSANPQITPNSSSDTSQQKVFTIDELKKYNGQNGNPAYVAVNGTVYDVSNSPRWRNGLHDDCSNSTYAGTDLSNVINSSPHGANIMKRMPVVGVLKK